MEKDSGDWLLDLLQNEAREYIGACHFHGEEIILMGFLSDFTRKCKIERTTLDKE